MIFPRAMTDIEKQNNWELDIDFLRAVKEALIGNTGADSMGYAGEFGLEDIESLLLAAEEVLPVIIRSDVK